MDLIDFDKKILIIFFSLYNKRGDLTMAKECYLETRNLTENEFRQFIILLAHACISGPELFDQIRRELGIKK
jgi:hypothetical protein